MMAELEEKAGKGTCVQLIAINKELSNCKTTVLFCLVLGKKKNENFISQLRAISNLLFLHRGWRKSRLPSLEFCCVCLELVCHDCLGQSGI